MTHPQDAWLPAAVLRDIAARAGTPCYAYSRARIEDNYTRLAGAFARAAAGAASPRVSFCYAVKANANHDVLKILNARGAGFDVVSLGELRAALHAGADPQRIVFAGVGKRDDELSAAVDAHIGWINVENVEELRVLSDLAAARGACQRVALRINPGVDPRTHAYLATGKTGSKFGLSIDDALMLVRDRAGYSGVSIEGLHVHNGSTITDTDVFAASAQVMLDVLAKCRALGATISDLDMGGGFGVAYLPGQSEADIEGIARTLTRMARGASVNLQLEPGRYLVADACVLLTRVLYTKVSSGKRYAIVDAAMNDLIRPALYGATHHIACLDPNAPAREQVMHEVVGPVCESGDFLGHAVMLPILSRGDLLVIGHAGAYGRSMASNYNLRPRAVEVLLDGDNWRVIRAREDIQALL
jgi:diaminopimelate decarboxylase